MGRKAGLTDEKLLAVADPRTLSGGFAAPAGANLNGAEGQDETSTRSRPIFNERELLVIELADAMANTPANISDDLYERLQAIFSPEQLIELAAQIAFENYRARSNRVFDVKSDDLYHPGAANDATKAQPAKG